MRFLPRTSSIRIAAACAAGLALAVVATNSSTAQDAPAPAAPAPAAPAQATPEQAASEQAAPAQAAPAQAGPTYAPEELETIVGPIALYPDPLLAQVLSAATFPDQVMAASQWALEHKDLGGEELGAAMDAAALTWDASVQGLIPFPEVLGELAEDPDWMKKLGDAMLTQRGDVMSAIQRMRKKAQDAGNLVSSEQLLVTSTPAQSAPAAPASGGTATTVAATTTTTIIEIQPANPQVIYVPTYPPTVYAPPPPGPSGAGIMMGFMTGVMIAEAFDDDWYGGCGMGWHSNTVIINNNSFNRNWNNRNNYQPPYNKPTPRGQGNRNRQGGGASASTLPSNRPGGGGAGAATQPSNRPGGGGAGTAARPSTRPGEGGAGAATQPSTRPGGGGAGAATQPATRPGGGGAGAATQPSTRPSGGDRSAPGSGSRGYSRPSNQGSAFSGSSNGRREASAGSRGRASGGGSRGGRGGGGRRR